MQTVIPLAMTTVVFPRFASVSRTELRRRHLLRGLVAVALFGGTATAILFAAPRTIIRLTFGSAYLRAATWLGPLAIAMTLLALINVYVYHFLSLGQSQYTLLVGAAAAVQVALYSLFHHRPADLIGGLIASASLLLVASEVFERRLHRRGEARSERHQEGDFVPLRWTAPIKDLSTTEVVNVIAVMRRLVE